MLRAFKPGASIVETKRSKVMDAAELSSLPHEPTTVRRPMVEVAGAIVAMPSGRREQAAVQFPGRIVVRASA